jgi:hypothetical protein
MTNNQDQEPESLTPEDRKLAHQEYMQKIAQNPRFKKIGKSGEGFTIVGMPRRDQQS